MKVGLGDVGEQTFLDILLLPKDSFSIFVVEFGTYCCLILLERSKLEPVYMDL